MGLSGMERLNAKKVSAVNTIIVITLIGIFLLLPMKEAASDISISAKDKNISVQGVVEKDVWFRFTLNNSGKKDFSGTIKVDYAQPFDDDENAPRPGSSIIATFGSKNKKSLYISKGGEETVSLTVRITKYAPGGTYKFPISVLDENETEIIREEKIAILTVEPFSDFDIEIEDKSATKQIHPSDRIDFPVTIINKGNIEEEIKFDLIDYPIDWVFSSNIGEGDIYFSENPVIVPIANPDKISQTGETTVQLTVVIPEDLEIEDYGSFDAKIEFRAESLLPGSNAEKPTDRIKIKVTLSEASIEAENIGKDDEFFNRLPFPKEFVLLFPVFVLLGGLVVVFSTRKKQEAAVSPWEEEEEVVDEIEEEGEEEEIEKKPIVKCPKCHVSIRVTNPKRPLTIKCPKCTVKFTIKGKEERMPKGKTIKCPKCSASMRIASTKRPLTISCFRCKTKIVLKAKGDKIPAKPKGKPINCPKCKAKLMITSDKRPLTIRCPKCKAKIVMKAKGEKTAVKVRPKAAVKPTTIKCPKCKTSLKIMSQKRPLTIHCPKCKAKVVLKAKEETKTKLQKPKAAAVKPTTIKCPKCKTSVKITNPKRPLTIQCPKCQAKVVLKAKEEPKAKPQKPRSAAVKPTTIKCPKCKTSLKITNQKRPLTIHCPKCRAKVVLKAKEEPKAKPQKPKGRVKPTTIKCPKCKTSLKVTTNKRPITISCPKCTAKLKLK